MPHGWRHAGAERCTAPPNCGRRQFGLLHATDALRRCASPHAAGNRGGCLLAGRGLQDYPPASVARGACSGEAVDAGAIAREVAMKTG
jgi:hypothetical protein